MDEVNNDKLAVVLADIHGQAKQFKKLIDLIRIKFGDEVNIYSTGDFIDRGQYSKEVIQICLNENVIGQIGNHDSWLQNLVKNGQFDSYAINPIMGGRPTIESYGVDIHRDGSSYFPDHKDLRLVGAELISKMPKSHGEWISKLPNYRFITVAGKSYWLIHSGLIHSTAISFKFTQDLKMLYTDSEMMEVISKTKPDNFLWPSPNINGVFKNPDNLYHFDDNAVQIFGHRPVKKPVIRDHFIALDTGCGTCEPYTLSAIVLPTMEIIRVEED